MVFVLVIFQLFFHFPLRRWRIEKSSSRFKGELKASAYGPQAWQAASRGTQQEPGTGRGLRMYPRAEAGPWVPGWKNHRGGRQGESHFVRDLEDVR